MIDKPKKQRYTYSARSGSQVEITIGPANQNTQGDTTAFNPNSWLLYTHMHMHITVMEFWYKLKQKIRLPTKFFVYYVRC